MNQSSARNQAYDLMRIVAALSVIVMHVTVNNMYSSPMESAKWVGSMALNSVSHFGVPVFVMISGEADSLFGTGVDAATDASFACPRRNRVFLPLA